MAVQPLWNAEVSYLATVLAVAVAASSTIAAEAPSSSPGRSASAGFSRSDALLPGMTTVEVFTFFDKSRPYPDGRPSAYWVLRKLHQQRRAPADVQWSDSRSCPLIVGVLGRLSSLATPPIAVAGVHPFDPLPTPPPGDTGASVWSKDSRQPDGASAQVRVNAGGGLIAAFVSDALRSLQPCWRDAPPTRPE